jgi:ribonuclease-3
LADAVEALIGAAYLDGGFEAAKKIYYALSLDKRASEGEWVLNPKGELQVFTQALLPPRTPVYELVETGGVAHKPVFKVKVIVEGVGEATASAGNRKEAESYAAHALLGRLKKELQ